MRACECPLLAPRSRAPTATPPLHAHWREARSHDASLINQELREVPFYAVAQQPALLLLKPNVERVGVLAVDLDLGKQRESYTIGSVSEGSDLRV
jgi:hypothetical protein